MYKLPATNLKLFHRVGDFTTITDALDYAAQGETGIVFYDVKGNIQSVLPYSDLRNKARDMALKLRSFGFPRGQHIAVIADTSPDFLVIFYGCQYAGLVPCPLPYTTYMAGKNAYLKRISSLTKVAQASLICIPDSFESLAEEIITSTNILTVTFKQLQACEREGDVFPLNEDEPAYVQFSSGSTSEPKGIIVTQRSLTNNIRGILHECIRITPADRAFSWLPLYHDMGLVGFALAPLFAQTTVDYISPMSFARSPTLWLELMSQNGTAITYAPSFGYELAAKRYGQKSFPLDLSGLRLAGIGGDMIQPKILALFTKTFSGSGFDPLAFTPSYGMAEATLLISFAQGLKTDNIDVYKFETMQNALKTDEVSSSKAFTLCGQTIKEHVVEVVSADKQPLNEREVGHIRVKGASLAQHYITASGIVPILDDNRYLDTGDMGYMVDGQIVITGRHKDMLLFNGRNIWPQDLENSVTNLTEIAIKNAVVFSDDRCDKKEIILLAEHSQADEETYRLVKSAINAQLIAVSGVSARIELVAPRTIPFTSSGKIARGVIKSLFLSSEIIFL